MFWTLSGSYGAGTDPVTAVIVSRVGVMEDVMEDEPDAGSLSETGEKIKRKKVSSSAIIFCHVRFSSALVFEQ